VSEQAPLKLRNNFNCIRVCDFVLNGLIPEHICELQAWVASGKERLTLLPYRRRP
jgi:hypothetical protein